METINYELHTLTDGESGRKVFVVETQEDAPNVVVGGPYASRDAAIRSGRMLKGISKLR